MRESDALAMLQSAFEPRELQEALQDKCNVFVSIEEAQSIVQWIAMQLTDEPEEGEEEIDDETEHDDEEHDDLPFDVGVDPRG